MIVIAKWTLVTFALFFFVAGLIMLFAPAKARHLLRQAGSTNFINYAEISIRMIPAAALVLYAEYSKYPVLFTIAGWFMLVTSLVLFLVPRQVHHNFSLRCADVLKPFYFRLIAPLAFAFGSLLLYALL